MSPVKIVAGTDIRDGVEVFMEINTFGNQDMLNLIIDTLRNNVDYDRWGYSLDFVQPVSTFDIPEEGNFMDYAVDV